VFADENARKQLEGILHPRIRQQWQARAQSWRAQNLSLGAVAIPLLFETGAETQFDSVICVACSSATQLVRLRSRGWSDEQIQQRIAAQWAVDQKIVRSNYVIWTEGSLQIHAAQLDRILQKLGASARLAGSVA